MLWRLHATVRSFQVPKCRRYSSKQLAEPLRILFCGSDDFSIASLESLHAAKLEEPKLIESIEVVHRPGKRTSRGLKVIRDVPIKQVAQEDLRLQTYEIDTFTGWTPPSPYNLIIAVSFGLLVPPRILNGAEYGGLNVHPSLLPDLRGPAPIHHTLLKKRGMTGVTVQTLHPTHFDRGTILAQTPPPGLCLVDISDLTPTKLTSVLAKVGAQMLVNVLKAQAYLPPFKDSGWYGKSGEPLEYAEKITKQHRYVNIDDCVADDIITRHRVLGGLWSYLPNGERIVLNEISLADPEDCPTERAGFVIGPNGQLMLRTTAGGIICITECTVAGGKRGTGSTHVKHVLDNVNAVTAL